MTRKRGRTGGKSGPRKGHSEPRSPATLPRPKEPGEAASFSQRQLWVVMLASFAVILAIGLVYQLSGHRDSFSKALEPSPAQFVGSETCAGCHRAEAKLWSASQHKAAMQHADENTVLGNFNDVGFDYFGMRSRFFREGTKFLVETDGPDGKLGVFQVKYTFGVDPLQQYLVEFPDGRLQALSLAWDSRPLDKGGQRWFHLSPNEEIKHDDMLHWTKLNQNWNFMCAECHSTGLRKNYDPRTDRFATTWAEISVGCEACHGQGSRHAAWARGQQGWWPFGKPEDSSKGLMVRFDERRDVTWPIEAQTGSAHRSVAPATLRKEVETCGLCHARRAGFHEDWVPGQWLSHTHAIEGLARNVYHADGQIRDVEEPYNYTPFKQGKMFAAGVTCSDCHEPHSAKLRASGERVCLQCHATDKYADVKHRRHASADPPTCMSCHMQTRTYMLVDPRHDHAFRIPRPDLSVKLGTPNACNDCHRDKPAQWAADTIEHWFGPVRRGFQTYGPAFHAARSDQADAAALLGVIAGDQIAPAVARASALSELAAWVSPANIGAAQAGLSDPDPMVRIGALDMLEAVPAGQAWLMVAPLLSDPVRGVRTRAVSLLAGVPAASQPPPDRAPFDRAAAEFIAAQRANAERPEARTALGSFFARRGLAKEAEAEYQTALRLSPQYATAAINLADLYRQMNRDPEGETTLRAALAASPRDAAVHHAMGLTLTRLKRPAEALAAFYRAAELEPDSAQYQYVYALGLWSGDRRADAVKVLQSALEKHPGNPEVLSALVSFSLAAGDTTAAHDYAERLAAVTPGQRTPTEIIEQLRQTRKSPLQ